MRFRTSSAPRLGKSAFLIAIAWLLSGLTQTLSAGECDNPAAIAVSIQGRVEMMPEGGSAWSPVDLNDPLCAGDRLRVGADSRAGLTLRNETLLRLDEHSSVTIRAPAADGTSWLDLLKGAAHFISRVKGTFKVKTPYVNASIEGTEFVLSVRDDATDIVVFEGIVLASNPAGSLKLAANQSGRVTKDQAPVRTTMANPRDAVVWTLYYPPLPKQPDAAYDLARQAVTAIAQNRLDEAEKLARQAIAANDRSAAAYMAQSYVDQARFDIPAALADSRRAAERAPNDALTQARLAEVWLMNGKTREARNAAEKAVSLDPQLSLAHTVLGFSSLRRVNLGSARSAFEKAVQLDSSAPLPRLGLGLVMIRQGSLQKGRREIETAVLLDPNSALLRSYLGKAYYEEKRDKRAATQFSLAKEFDDLDPTAWFYDAILKQSENRPIEALNELDTSIALNDNRAVYRSRFLLDQDEAARNASQARIYQDLGFEQLARTEAYKSLNTSNQSHSAHRLLSDSYSGQPLLEKARLSELLQSQLLQPLNRNPIQPQLAASRLGILDGAGPTASGFSEYTPLFTRNGLGLQLNAIGGSNHTVGDDLILSGLYDRAAFSLGQFHYKSDGWRENNDLKQDIYDAFLQFALTASTSLQLEYRHRDAESGDLGFRFEPDDFTDWRNDLKHRTKRIGFHHQFAFDGHLIASIIAQDRLETASLNESTPIGLIPTPMGDYPGTQVYSENVTQDSETRTLELQFSQPFHDHTFTLGFGRHFEDYTQYRTIQLTITAPQPVPPYHFDIPIPIPQSPPDFFDPSFKNIYLYSQLALPARVNMTLGVTREDFKISYLDTGRTNPKFGLTWEASDNVTFRTAYLKSLARPIYMEQTIEQTQIAGFNQLFDDVAGSEIDQFGFGVDAKLNSDLSVGAQFTRRDLEVPLFTSGVGVIYESRDEKISNAYLYWTATERLGMHIAYEREVFDRPLLPPESLTTQRTPIGFSYHWPSGIVVQAEGTYVNQEISRSGETEREKFWNLDAVFGYRFPNRYGKAEIIVKNLLDKSFNYYDMSFHTGEFLTPRFLPERQVFARFTINF